MRAKPLGWLHGEVKSPPLSAAARIEVGALLRRLQYGESLAMPHSRPMPVLGPRCHELRIPDGDVSWRLFYRTDPGAILILDVFRKTTPTTPHRILERCRERLERFDRTGDAR
jgi:phage-related protein